MPEEQTPAWAQQLIKAVNNLAAQQEELGLKIGAVETRLGHVEHAVNRVATKVGVPGVPAASGPHPAPVPMAAQSTP